MATGAFSSAAKRMKKLNVSLNGTTVDVAWATSQLEESIDYVPGLESAESIRAKYALDTATKSPSLNDPYHAAIEIFDGKGDGLTSAHCYPNGYVKFSKDKYGDANVAPRPGAPVFTPLNQPGSKGKPGPKSGSHPGASYGAAAGKEDKSNNNRSNDNKKMQN